MLIVASLSDCIQALNDAVMSIEYCETRVENTNTHKKDGYHEAQVIMNVMIALVTRHWMSTMKKSSKRQWMVPVGAQGHRVWMMSGS